MTPRLQKALGASRVPRLPRNNRKKKHSQFSSSPAFCVQACSFLAQPCRPQFPHLLLSLVVATFLASSASSLSVLLLAADEEEVMMMCWHSGEAQSKRLATTRLRWCVAVDNGDGWGRRWGAGLHEMRRRGRRRWALTALLWTAIFI